MASRVRARGARQDEAQDAPSSSDAARGASGASARASDDDGATSVNAELETFIVARYLRRRGRTARAARGVRRRRRVLRFVLALSLIHI